ncbi:hypothetical protein AG1IA_09914 [Rhizoctonia solani AG-1 IA]|uniref:Uncharacterized protein n=1 Tax=Thanatephorus cucumeris (strain AG1-IA) TaxID=983506 RepID=L8WCZ5_THACA|nr:hypothetical protein AG1IA_09914 [Rhizoctonia solani AG-1 IA]
MFRSAAVVHHLTAHPDRNQPRLISLQKRRYSHSTKILRLGVFSIHSNWSPHHVAEVGGLFAALRNLIIGGHCSTLPPTTIS